MKKYLMSGALALIAGFFVTSCHDDDVYVNSDVIDQKVQNFRKAFKESFGSINPNQTWGFKQSAASATTGMANNANMNVNGYNPNWGFGATPLTRTVATWDGTHSCAVSNWNAALTITLPDGAVDVTNPELFNQYGNYQGPSNVAAWYVPKEFNGELNLHNMNLSGSFYNLGTLTALNSVNYNGTITFYNAGTMTYTVQSGNRHTVINTGTLTVKSFNNLGTLYNGGSLTFDNWGNSADIPNAMTIYSNGVGTIEFPHGGDLKATCDIHGTINVTGNLKIQNSTKKYICGIVATGTVENVDGPLETSYVKANIFKFDGNPIYLLPGGHVDVTTLQTSNSQCYFYGAAGSNGLVEATNFEFGNKNDFTHTFSNNIYFKVNGGYIKCDGCYAMGHNHYFNNVAEYLASDAHTSDNKTDEYALAKDRINSGNASGSSACGDSWEVGNPGTTSDPETPNNPNNPNDSGHEDNTETIVDGNTTTVIDSTFFYRRAYDEVGRIFCEDMGVNYSNRDDFDYNDAVFDVTIMTRTEHCKITTTTTTINYETVLVDSTFNDEKNIFEYNYEDIPTDTTTVADSVTIDVGDPRYFAKIYLYAAGGTIPLTIAGVEVHDAFGVGHTTMVNTRDEHTDKHYTVNGANTVSREPVILKNPNGIAESEGGEGIEWFEFGRDIEYYSDEMPNANDVPVRVYFGDVNIVKELESIKGDAPQKIKVGLNTLWASERCYFGDAYPKFTDYVKDGSADWQNYGNSDYLYNETASVSTEVEGTTETTISKSGSVTEHVLYNNPDGYDISRGLYFTDRSLLTVKLDIQVGDKLRFYATKDEDIKSDGWCIFLADGNSTRLHADQTSLNNHDYAEVTLTADLVSKLRSNATNAAMVISGYGVRLTKVTLIKK